MTAIIIPFQNIDLDDFANSFQYFENRVQGIEIWADDFIENPEREKIFAKIFDICQMHGLFSIVVCKSIEQGGSFYGSTSERIELLKEALSLGADFVDLDITENTSDEISIIDPDKLILSLHDFVGVSIDFREFLSSMMAHQPFLYKFAMTTNNKHELEEFLKQFQNIPSDIKFILSPMGDFGQSGRKMLFGKNWGEFVAIDEAHRTSLGQRTLAEILN